MLVPHYKRRTPFVGAACGRPRPRIIPRHTFPQADGVCRTAKGRPYDDLLPLTLTVNCQSQPISVRAMIASCASGIRVENRAQYPATRTMRSA